ncbi:hypothetical protein LMC88_26875 [Escherichia coli]|nr:hypothetical protein [Escherichia coli]MCC8209816.1 hypothetical protein [Escherichia coli]
MTLTLPVTPSAGGVDPQALTTSGNISTQSFIFSSRIG